MGDIRPRTDNSTTPIFNTGIQTIEMDTITRCSNNASTTTTLTSKPQPEIEIEIQTKELPDPEYLRGFPLYLVLFGTTLTLFLIQLDQSVMIPVSLIPGVRYGGLREEERVC